MSEVIQQSNGQDAKGRFRPGNRLGKGNPMAGRAARIRAALLRALTPADTTAIAEQLIQQAKGGDIAAINAILDRTIGKPGVPVDLTVHTKQERSPLDTLMETDAEARATMLDMMERALIAQQKALPSP